MTVDTRLTGKVAIVTGAGRGIGFCVARTFARQGARVMIADLGSALDGTGHDARTAQQAAEAVSAEGGTCKAIATDVGDPKQSDAVIAETLSHFGKIDILVNAAGILRAGSILDLTLDDWHSTLRVHLGGALNTTRALVAHWAESEGMHRRVINFASDAGLYGEGPYAAYAAAKAGLIALTLSCAETFSPLGATANVFIPQAATRMTASIPTDYLPDADRWGTDEFDPVHVPPALVYIASNDADWLSGQILGGWGYEVHLYSKPERSYSIFSPGPWDLDVLFRRLPQAFRPSTGSA